MGRYSPSGSKDHRIQRMGRDWYRLTWSVDRYYPGSRLRWPRSCYRDTDEAGARRFAKKWDVKMPEPRAPGGTVRAGAPN